MVGWTWKKKKKYYFCLNAIIIHDENAANLLLREQSKRLLRGHFSPLGSLNQSGLSLSVLAKDVLKLFFFRVPIELITSQAGA